MLKVAPDSRSQGRAWQGRVPLGSDSDWDQLIEPS